jgi:hypothetical protein
MLAFFLGCEGWQSVLIESEDFEPQLNVLAILSPDEGGVVEVQVMRTLPLEGPDGERGDPDTVCFDDGEYRQCYIDYQWISYYKVTDATVTLSEGATTYLFVYDSTQKANDGPGMWPAAQARGYVPVDTTFVPRTGVRYELAVEALDSLEVSGSCTIPPPVEIKVGQDYLPDTLRSGELFTVAWNPVTDYVRVKIEPVEEQPFRTKYCFVWEEAIVRHDSSITFLIVPECWEVEDPFGPGMEADTLDPYVDYVEVEIVVTAMDERYYNYFYGGDMGPDYEEIMFIFLGEGDTGRNQGIEGGLGIFASFRSSSVRRFIKL